MGSNHISLRPRSRWRRFITLALTPLLALTAIAAHAQGVWLTLPLMTPRAFAARATAPCPHGLKNLCVYVVGGRGGTNLMTPQGTAEAFSPAAGTWASLQGMLTPRQDLAGVGAPCPKGVRRACVYAIGGYGAKTGDPAVVSNTVEAYSPATNGWITLPTLPTARQGLAGVKAPCPEDLGVPLRGTCVYALGGITATGATPVRTAEVYSPATNTWGTLPDMNIPRAYLGGAAAACPSGLGLHGTCVYAIGGITGTGPTAAVTNEVEVYSPAANMWVTLATMTTARSDLATVGAPCPRGVVNGCVYAIGGSDGTTSLDTVEVYSPATNAWVSLPGIPTARRGLMGTAANCPKAPKERCVYAIGGIGAPPPTGNAAAAAVDTFLGT
ncbi:MAG: hypothetical protein QOF44_3321, partial [Streptomyces sp.]|nr:hypothetical protein [Streptomyces sp.]